MIFGKTPPFFMNDDDKKDFYLEQERQAKLENERFDNLCCPCCKSKEKKNVVHSKSNDIYGPGYHCVIIDEYLVCLNCGIMYKDLHKLK